LSRLSENSEYEPTVSYRVSSISMIF